MIGKKGGLLLAGLILLGLGAYVFFFRSETMAPEMRSFSGSIKDIRRDGEALILAVDELEFLSGEEAIAKGMIDTGCSRAELSDCIPSLNNDIYVRNLTGDLKDYRLEPGTEMNILKDSGSPVLESSTIPQFELKYSDTGQSMRTQPFHFRARGEEIIWLEEQYTP